jgi:4-hydroxy-tetrahydrodipicolinate synthase
MTKDRFGKKYERMFVALLTPFKENYKVDEPALRKLLKYYLQPKFVDAGGAVIINPEAGELFCMSREEKRRNVEIAMEECGGKVPVFAGVIDMSTEDTVKVAVDAKKCGVDGIFIMPPMGSIDISMTWNPEKYPEVWIDMVKAQMDAVDLPGIVHPIAPGGPVFGMGLPLGPTLQMCREVPNIIGWKMTYAPNGWNLIAEGLRSLERRVAIMCAPANLFHHNLADEYFDGTVSGSFTYAMETMLEHIKAWKSNDVVKARKLWNAGLANLQNYVYSDFSRLHVKYKIASWLRGLIPLPYMRPPMPKPRKLEVQTLYSLLKKNGLSVIPEKDVKKVVDTLVL